MEENKDQTTITEEEEKPVTTINDEEISEEDIQNWLKSLDEETETKEDKETKSTDKKTPQYVTKDDLEEVIGKMLKKNIDESDDESPNTKLTIEDVQAVIAKHNTDLKNEFLNVIKSDQIENKADQFEEIVNKKYPDFKIDKLHLEYDVSRGMSIEKALEKQMKVEQQRIINYKKNFDNGTYKVEVPKSTSKDLDLDNALPVELKDFNPKLHEDRDAFKKEYPNSEARDNYFRKLELYENSKIKK